MNACTALILHPTASAGGPDFDPYIQPTPFRTWMIDKIAGAMNLVSECVCEDDPEAPITWRDELRWLLEGWLSWLFGLFWKGCANELHAVLNGEAYEPYLSDRQLAFCKQWGIQPEPLISSWLDDACSHCPACEWSDFPNLAPDNICPCCGAIVTPPID